MCFTGKSHTYRNNLKITATAARERQRRTTGGHPPNRHAVQATRAAGGNRLPRGTPLGATPAAAAQRPPGPHSPRFGSAAATRGQRRADRHGIK